MKGQTMKGYWLVLGEAITGWQWAGIALVVAALATVLLAPRFSGKNRA